MLIRIKRKLHASAPGNALPTDKNQFREPQNEGRNTGCATPKAAAGDRARQRAACHSKSPHALAKKQKSVVPSKEAKRPQASAPGSSLPINKTPASANLKPKKDMANPLPPITLKIDEKTARILMGLDPIPGLDEARALNKAIKERGVRFKVG